MADRSARILYVEDNPDNRLLVRRVLEAAGYVVLEAPDAPSGLAQALTARPDLILVDINLPGTDGYALTARLKAAPGLEQIRVVALTANVMKGDRERTLAAGCDGYIQKPIDVDALPGQIARYLNNV
ncbi:MAG: response regulator [Anaerolineales bacterium]|nr:response regulator [Anaerolineales bacterium]